MLFYLVKDVCVAMNGFVAWIPVILHCATYSLKQLLFLFLILKRPSEKRGGIMQYDSTTWRLVGGRLHTRV